MSVGHGLFVLPDGAGNGTTPVEARRALQAIIPWAGIVDGCVVSGKTGEWRYAVGEGHPATSRGGVDGMVAMSIDGATDTPEVAGAPTSGSRWDLIWTRQRDPQAGDSDSLPVLGVTSGVASGSPSKPYADVPTGALVLAEAQVAAGATGTAHASVVITQVAPPTGPRWGIIPVTSDAQRNLLDGYATAKTPVVVQHIAPSPKSGQLERNAGSGWTVVGGSAGTSGVLAGTAPPAGTPLLTKTFYGTTSATNSNGITTLTFPGGAFPHGVVSAQIGLARVDGTAQSALVLQIGACTLSAIDVRVAGLVSGAFAFLSGAAPSVSLVATGW